MLDRDLSEFTNSQNFIEERSWSKKWPHIVIAIGSPKELKAEEP